MIILRELISQARDVIKTNPIVAWSRTLTGGLHANKKNEIRSAQSRDITHEGTVKDTFSYTYHTDST
jgi:hypothetical protein